jgi:hypothetical protein
MMGDNFKLISLPGEARIWTFTADRDATLPELQEKVGGLIEIVGGGDDWLCLANEEGMIKDLPTNTLASRLCGQLIVGDVVVMPKKHFN